MQTLLPSTQGVTQYGLMAARCTKDTCNLHPAEQLSPLQHQAAMDHLPGTQGVQGPGV